MRANLAFSKATGGAARIIRSLNAAGVEVSLPIRISYVAQSEINFSSGWTLEHETSDWCPGQQFFRRSSRQGELKAGAAGQVGARPQSSVMRFENRVVYGDRILPGRRFFYERADPPDDLAHLAEIRWLRAHPAQGSLRVCDCRCDRLVHFVGDRGRQLARRRDAIGVRELQLNLAISPFAFASLCLRALSVCQIDYECNALVAVLFKCCPTNQHGHTATVFSRVFFFEWLEPSATFLLFHPCVTSVAPVGRRQICPPYAARE